MVDRNGRARPIVMLAVLIVAGAAAAWLWLRPPAQPGVDAGRAIAESFLQHLREGHPDKAWEATTADFKSDQGKERFIAEAKKAGLLQQEWEFVSAQSVMVQERPRSEFAFRTKSNKTVRLILGRDGGAWKIDRMAK